MIPSRASPRRFTGRHMATVMVGFFAVVVAVNMLMATLAVRGFGGTVVDNSYVASQQFNGWLRAARAQSRLGWMSEVTLDRARFVKVRLTGADAKPLSDTQLTGIARHPLGRMADVTLEFDEVAPGHFSTRSALPRGRWQVALVAKRGTTTLRIAQEVR